MSIVVILCICIFCAIYAKELVVVKQYENENDKTYYYCITNTSFPLSWVNDNYIELQQAPSTYIPYSQTNILIEQFSKKWVKENSLSGSINEIILDRRWEDLPLLTTYSDNNTFKYIRTITTVKQDDFVIPFSVKINKAAHVLLCDIRKKNCYWFIIEETKIVLKKCEMTQYKGQSCISSINSRFALNVSDYFNTVMEVNNPTKYLDDKKWTHFKFHKKGNHFIILKQNPVNESSNIMKYMEKSATFQINRIFIHSNSNKKGFWKIHELNYYYTTETLYQDEIGLLSNDFNTGMCVSMFISMCKSCQLTLTLSTKLDDSNTLMEETYNHSIWTEIKLSGENPNHSKVVLSASTKNNLDSEGFWAIDKIRPCHKKEFRVIKALSDKDLKCELMNYEQETISVDEEMENIDNNCPENTISRFCIPCSWIFYNNSNVCGRLKICENYNKNSNKNKLCQCSEGYKTNILDCSSPCSRGTYGHGCKKKCKYCKDLKCNHVDGYCTSSCINNYSGLKCNIAPLPAPEEFTTVLKDVTEYYNFTSTEKTWRSRTMPVFVSSVKSTTQETTVLINNNIEQTFIVPVTNKITNVAQNYSTTTISTTKKAHTKTATNEVKHTTQKSPFDVPLNNIIFSVLGFLLMLSVCFVVYFTYSRKKKVLLPKYSKLVKNNRLRNISENSKTKDDQIPFIVSSPTCAKMGVLSRPIKITEFEQYVKESMKNGVLDCQFAAFSCESTKSWNCSAPKENRHKNCYDNLNPYDHTRVALQNINGVEFSDYINADYIDGYRISKAYIATQSPKKKTFYDFWRMIWQTNVRYIVMLSRKEKKSEQYWPTEINTSVSFYDITVHYSFNQVFSEYVRRTFHVTRNNQSRTVEQIHLQVWHNHGIPFYPRDVVPFLKQLREFPLTLESPIVVHCSGGVGKTGIVLLCDICLRMAKEGVVDIQQTLQKLRQQRPNMVKNVEQYKLAHLVIVEYIFGKTTAIGYDEIMYLDINEIKNCLREIKETEWRENLLKSITKNKLADTNLNTENGIKLPQYSLTANIYTYINAVTVDSFKIFERFIVTHYPVPNTLGYFWRLALEKDVSVMVFLNEQDPKEPNPCLFYPDSKNPVLTPVDYLTVKYISSVSLASYDLITASLLMNNENFSKELKIILMKNWPAGKLYPEKTANFLTCIEDLRMLYKWNKQHIIVGCYDGFTAAGLFTAMDFVIEKMKREHVCDVCEAVKTVRRSCKDFVRKEEQFFFLYNAAKSHLQNFFPYINFQ